jgi:4-hydroxy-3-methylbut-2-enyl diphosphate reductase
MGMTLFREAPQVQKRTIKLARVAGFCFGVRRAIEMAQQARRECEGGVATLGQIVHNSQVQYLRQRMA